MCHLFINSNRQASLLREQYKQFLHKRERSNVYRSILWRLICKLELSFLKYSFMFSTYFVLILIRYDFLSISQGRQIMNLPCHIETPFFLFLMLILWDVFFLVNSVRIPCLLSRYLVIKYSDN